MKLRLALAFVAASAVPAFAQETQQDLAARIVKEQTDIRAAALDRVMTAHTRAIEHTNKDAYSSVRLDAVAKSEPAAPPAAPWRPPERGGSVMLILLACALPVIPLLLLGVAYWRKWRFDER